MEGGEIKAATAKNAKELLLRRMLARARHIGNLKLFFADYNPIEFDALTTPIIVDLQHLQRKGIRLDYFGVFLNQCLNKNALQIFDHPSAPKSGVYCHLEGKAIRKRHVAVAKYALNCYRDHNPQGSKMKFKKVIKMRCAAQCYTFYFITFKVTDELGQDERTLQALVVEFAPGDYQLGMLRDDSSNRVLAALLQFKEAPTGDTAVILSKRLDDVWKKVLLKTEM